MSGLVMVAASIVAGYLFAVAALFVFLVVLALRSRSRR